MTPCTGSWPYKAGSTNTYSTPYPILGSSTGDLSAIYFGDDAGVLHCVRVANDATSGTSCWSGGPTTLAQSGPTALSGPVLMLDPAANVPAIFVGDASGRFFRVEDNGTTPAPAPSSTVSAYTLSGSGGDPAIRSMPSIDQSINRIYVMSAGYVYEFPIDLSASWQPDAPAKQLVSSPLNGPAFGSIASNWNGFQYATLRNTLYKIQYPFDGTANSNIFSVPLVSEVSKAPSNGDVTTSDSFSLGGALVDYNSVFVGSGTNANGDESGGLEEYGCDPTATNPVLEGVTSVKHGNLVTTGFVMDWQNGNLNYGFTTASNTGGIVQYPAANPPVGPPLNPGWVCPPNTVATTSGACGSVACACLAPNVVCAGACINTQSDLGNCGGCGNVCAGTCTNGHCATPLATGQFEPFALAVDSANVYWTNNYNGTVMRVAIGGGPAVAIASAQGHPQGIAIDATNAYWATGTNVVQVPLAGGSVTTLASGQNAPWAVAADGTNVYWTNEGSFGSGFKNGTVVDLSLG
jgi:hypothetical protein